MRRTGLAATVAALAIAVPATAKDRVYFGGYGGGAPVSFGFLDGSGGADLFTDDPDNETFGIAIDAAAGRLYYAEDSGNRIAFADLDGSGGGPVKTTGATVTNPEGIALDTATRTVYWSGANKISYAKLDGSAAGDLDTGVAPIVNPEGIAIDPAGNRVYWANNSANTIAYANLDGTGGGGTVNTTGATTDYPEGLALDVAGGRVYWANDQGGKISFANLDGSGGGDIDTSGASPFTSAVGVAIDRDANRIYWADNGSPGGISYANLDGTGQGGDVSLTGATVDGPAMPALLEAPRPAGAPEITGATPPGSVLSCSQGGWAPDVLGAFLFRVPQASAYQWSRDGADIAGGTAATFTASVPGQYRCTVRASNAAGSATQTSAPLTVAANVVAPPPPAKPVLSALKASRKTFTVKRGTVFSFRLDQAATVTIVIRKATGRKAKVQTLRRAAKAGLNKLAFHGRVRGKPFKPGRYRAMFTAANSAGSGTPKALTFKIVRAH
jgi:DNA-binding beta-propeller fold protein YncE